MTRIACLTLILVWTVGCAFTPHQVNVAVSQPAAAPAVAKKATTVRLRVVDERDDANLGRRGAGIAAAKVTIDGLMPAFTTAVEEGFRRKGYALTNDAVQADADLLVALRGLKFDESAGFFTVGAEAVATIHAEARRGTQDYRNQYRSSDEDRQLAISFGDGIDEQVNLVLNKALAQLLSDSRLDDLLSGE